MVKGAESTISPDSAPKRRGSGCEIKNKSRLNFHPSTRRCETKINTNFAPLESGTISSYLNIHPHPTERIASETLSNRSYSRSHAYTQAFPYTHALIEKYLRLFNSCLKWQGAKTDFSDNPHPRKSGLLFRRLNPEGIRVRNLQKTEIRTSHKPAASSPSGNRPAAPARPLGRMTLLYHSSKVYETGCCRQHPV